MITTTDRQTVIPPYGARHILDPLSPVHTLCGLPLPENSVLFPPAPGQRISCQHCATAQGNRSPYLADTAAAEYAHVADDVCGYCGTHVDRSSPEGETLGRFHDDKGCTP